MNSRGEGKDLTPDDFRVSPLSRGGDGQKPYDATGHQTKTLRRTRHLEILVFELCELVFLLCGDEVVADSDIGDTAVAVRGLQKALAHGRRPDGSKY